MRREGPLISEERAGCLARVVNRVAEAFDVAALSNEEVVEVTMLLDRLAGALLHAHTPVLLPLYELLAESYGWLKDDEPEDDEPEDPSGDSH